MKTTINEFDWARINQGVVAITNYLSEANHNPCNRTLRVARETTVEFLDNDFSPPLRPGWREAWKRNQKMRSWMGDDAWLGDVYSGHFQGDPLSEQQWEYLYRVAVALVRLAVEGSLNELYRQDARRVISDYLETVMTTAPG